ncbi:MAG: catalase family protein [Bacteriovorax sp.]|nr:catalase family protein [Bacteriovorax sp.]
MKVFKKRKLISLILSLLFLGFFSYRKINSRVSHRFPASSNIMQPAVELGEVWTSEDRTNSDEITQIIGNALEQRTAGVTLMKRDAHPKHHGCLKAFFQIDSHQLPLEQQVGVFSKENQKEFLAWIRFSNGDPDSTKADADGDVRGMAIKLMNVNNSASGSQDFLLMNSKTFFIKDSAEYLDLMQSIDSTISLGWFFLTHSHDRQILLAARGMKVGNPLDVNYFSATPYKLGGTTMKFSAKPCLINRTPEGVSKNPTHNFLRENLVKSIGKSEACFDFFIQRNTSPETMPIENPTVEWSEVKSPFIKVATIHIPIQSGSDSEELMNYCENLSFDPWHTLPEQRPLGAINRIRLQAYSEISKKRHLHNRIPQIEPRNHEACNRETQELCQNR